MTFTPDPDKLLESKLLRNLIFLAVSGLLTWSTYTTYQTSLLVRENSTILQTITGGNLDNRLTAIETVSLRNARDITDIQTRLRELERAGR